VVCPFAGVDRKFEAGRQMTRLTRSRSLPRDPTVLGFTIIARYREIVSGIPTGALFDVYLVNNK